MQIKIDASNSIYSQLDNVLCNAYFENMEHGANSDVFFDTFIENYASDCGIRMHAHYDKHFSFIHGNASSSGWYYVLESEDDYLKLLVLM